MWICVFRCAPGRKPQADKGWRDSRDMTQHSNDLMDKGENESFLQTGMVKPARGNHLQSWQRHTQHAE